MKEFKEILRAKEADQLEVYYNSTSSKEIAVKSNGIAEISENNTSGAGIRAIIKNKIGFAYTSNLNKLKETAKLAVKLAKHSNETVKLKTYQKYPKPKRIFDKKFNSINESDVFNDINSAIKYAKINNSTIIAGSVSLTQIESRYLNSEGSDLQEKSTYFASDISANYRDSDGVWGSYSTIFKHNFKDITKKAVEMAKQMSVKGKIKTGDYDVVLHPLGMPDLFDSAIFPNFNADFIQKGKSKLSNQIGNKIFSDKLNITDNGIMDAGWNSSSFDAEGVPSQETKLIEKGILKNFMYDLIRAQKENKESTSNAARSFRAQPIIAPRNFIIHPGKHDPIKNIDKGLLIYSPLNSHGVNPSSGDFSLGVYLGLWIENGEIKFSPKQAMVSGNLFDVFKNIKLIGNDVMDMGGLISPSIVATMHVIGDWDVKTPLKESP